MQPIKTDEPDNPEPIKRAAFDGGDGGGYDGTMRERVGRLESFANEARRRFDSIDARFDRVDERFDRVDERFDRVDERFDRVDERFDRVDEQFKRVDERFQRVDERFQRVDEQFKRVDEQFKHVDEQFKHVDEQFKRVDQRFDRMDERLDHFNRRLEEYRIETKRDIDNAIKWIVGVMIAISMAAITIMTFVLNNAVPRSPAGPQPPIIIYAGQAPVAQPGATSK